MSKDSAVEERRAVTIPGLITVRQLAELLGVSPVDVIKELISDGIMANINQTIDYDTAAVVATDLGYEPREEEPTPPVESAPEPVAPPSEVPVKPLHADEAPEDLEPRPPVITVMGHVDHGKTSLLDVIREANVVETEVGGITQHIGAYQVERDGRVITFIDTPGHEAFTAMRARGAQVTDIAVLVVSGDDGVMPQTREAIDHARAANVPIVVAINKMDLKTADAARVKQQLAELGLVPEEQGGAVIMVEVSAREKTGIDQLLEMILLVADISELKANPNRPAVGAVVEGQLDRTRGPLATLLVQAGTLQVGDRLVIDAIHGRVRAMFDPAGNRVEVAHPSMPVLVLGMPEVPVAGEVFDEVADEKTARARAEARASEKAAAQRPAPRVSLEDLYAQIEAGKVKELGLILKADVQGSVEAAHQALEALGDGNLKVRIIHEATGEISESDVELAVASEAVIVGFNVQAGRVARSRADVEGVDIRTYQTIYRLIEDVEKSLEGMLEPVYEDVPVGKAEVRDIFDASKRGKVAGVMVVEGTVRRDARARLLRGSDEMWKGRIASVRRFQEKVQEVTEGFECGIGLDGFQDFEEGDIIEILKRERVR
ncbi:MAG: translation initiation factor IF-2 [Anaerolineae bacterium]